MSAFWLPATNCTVWASQHILHVLLTVSLTYRTHSCPIGAYQVSCCYKSTLWLCNFMLTVRHVTARKRRINSGSVRGCDVSTRILRRSFYYRGWPPWQFSRRQFSQEALQWYTKIFFVTIYGFLCLFRYSSSVSVLPVSAPYAISRSASCLYNLPEC